MGDRGMLSWALLFLIVALAAGKPDHRTDAENEILQTVEALCGDERTDAWHGSSNARTRTNHRGAEP
jgi:hypothetical protein